MVSVNEGDLKGNILIPVEPIDLEDCDASEAKGENLDSSPLPTFPGPFDIIQ